MKSTSGAHFIALDHVRALAAFMVFSWHFTHGETGYPIPFAFLPSLAAAPAALFDEGHTGVALFMTLSGYLFAKLLNGKPIIYRAFLWNRVLRLLPLLGVVIAIDAIKDRIAGGSALLYGLATLRGLVLPTLPNGGWSVTVEFQFYLLLPLLLWALRKSSWLPLSLLLAAIALRTGMYLSQGEVQTLSYWTLIGRIDQFVLGILAFQFRSFIKGRHAIAVAIVVAFVAFYWIFDRLGGFYQMPTYPSSSPLWIVMPTIEGFAYAAVIAWYEQSFAFRTSGISGFIGQMGSYSYSIYLLHFYWVFDAAQLIDERVMPLHNFYMAWLWAFAAYLLMMPIGYLSYRFVESPFLRLRKPYIRRATQPLPADVADRTGFDGLQQADGGHR